MEAKILRLPEVIARTGCSRSTVYRMIGKGEFVRPVQLSERNIGFHEKEVAQWIQSRQRA